MRRAGPRLKVPFFEYCDVFEDFYRHYGVDQSTFARTWVGTGNHGFIRLLQREVDYERRRLAHPMSRRLAGSISVL